MANLNRWHACLHGTQTSLPNGPSPHVFLASDLADVALAPDSDVPLEDEVLLEGAELLLDDEGEAAAEADESALALLL